MLKVMESAVEKYQWYIGESWQYLLFLLALLYLIYSSRERESRRLFVGYTGVFFIIYLFPVTAKIIMDFCIGELVYWRMLWLLPIPVILAYVCTRIWGRMKSRTAKGASLAVMALLLILSGKCVYGGDTPYQKARNLFKIPPEVCWTCDLIRQNAPQDGELKVVAPAELVCYIRQYDAGIELAYGRTESSSKKRRQIAKQMLAKEPNFRLIAKNARKLECNFLIYPTDEGQDAEIRSLGYEYVGTVNTYNIYRDTVS